MLVGVVIPDKKDRPMFLKHCLDMLERQTIAPDFICVMDADSQIVECDITWRYRNGFEIIFDKYDCDVCFLIENDDWYKDNYIEQMLKYWSSAGKPDLFGVGITTYYHIGLRKYKKLLHQNRASAFSSMVTKKIMDVPFCKDTEAFLDMHLWKQDIFKGTFIPDQQICLGIKHGQGLCGGKGHNKDFPFDNDDKALSYISKIIDIKSLNFYFNERQG